MDQAISLDKQRADAIHLLYLIDAAWPDHFDKHGIEDTFQATDELTQLTSVLDAQFEIYLNDEKLENTQDSFYSFIASKSFELKQDRLLQCIELYHALNLANKYSVNNKGSLSDKFTTLSTTDERLLLKDHLQYELDDLADAIKIDPASPDNIEKQLLLTQGKTELNNVFGAVTSTDAQRIDFSLETIVTYSLAMTTCELEFATAIAIKYDRHQDDNFLGRRNYLTGLIQHIGKISDSLRPEHNWEVVDEMLVRPATTAMQLN